MASTPNKIAAAAKCFIKSIAPGDQLGCALYLWNIMSGLNLTPNQLQTASQCFIKSIPKGDQLGCVLYFLNILTGLNLTPEQLNANSKCFTSVGGFPEGSQMGAMVYLLNQAYGGETCVVVSGAGSASVDGTYYVTGQAGGKNQYTSGLNTISWSVGLASWILGTASIVYSSSSNVATPDLASNWTSGFGASNPAPTVTSC